MAFASLGLDLGDELKPKLEKSSRAMDFKLKFYVSFQNRKDSIGLELLQALDAFCKVNKLNNFELFTRLSQEKVNPARWDENFIKRELGKDNPAEIKRIWVCGPPVMAETFDKAFQTMVSDVKLSVIKQLTFSKDQFEIL